jgi:tRNA(Ile2)-agmatinylcytidine synthase
MTVEEVHIGLDDIDSPLGGCTTHFASLLAEHLDREAIEWKDYPRLIRLNPGIPFRTRGNGAVALRLSYQSNLIDMLLGHIEKMIHEYVDESYPNTNPGVVILAGSIPERVQTLSQNALWRAVPIDLARRVLKQCNAVSYQGGNGRGLIGALSAIGNLLTQDHTYEYIAYRSRHHCDEKRGVDPDSVAEMVKRMGTRVFSNIDSLDGRILIEPHGPDPVIFGIRGESAEDVIEAARYVRCNQPVDRWMVFRSNQGTGEHLTHGIRIQDLRPYMACTVHGHVEKSPRIMEGGHVIFRIREGKERVDCAAYEPTRGFRELVRALRPGDEIQVHANVRPKSRKHGLTLNLEGLDIIDLVAQVRQVNPTCPHCLKRMKSAGKEKGYKCFKCGFKDQTAAKIEIPVERTIKEGVYLPPLSAQRHLTKPMSRLGLIKSARSVHLIEKWHYPGFE